MTHSYLSEFVDGYITAALWTEHDDSGDHDDSNFLDTNTEHADLSAQSIAAIVHESADFVRANWSDLQAADYGARGEYSPAELAGHDFLLTRNGHGAGFWDRGLGELGDRLSDAAQVYGSTYLYRGDDGQVWAS